MGSLLVLNDVDKLDRVRREVDFAESVIDSIGTPLVLLQHNFRIAFANRAFLDYYGSTRAEIQTRNFFLIGGKQWNLPGLRRAAERVRTNSEAPPEVEVETELPGGERNTVSVKVSAVHRADERLILVAIEDITARKRSERIVLEEQKRLQSSLRAQTAQLENANRILQAEISGRAQMETALHKSEAALLKSREELRHLSASLMNAQDAERRRVSRELHDDLSQKVAKLQFEVELLEQKVPFSDLKDARERLRGVSQQAATLSEDLRRVAHQLHPATLDHLGLSVALRSYTEEFSRSSAIRVKFTSSSVPRDLPIELASGLYRIVQEALRNVAKHASNASVKIVLRRVPSGIALFIRDDGEGFDIESARGKGGLGLISMQERVRLLDGTFSLETKPGQGLLISIRCPLPLGTS